MLFLPDRGPDRRSRVLAARPDTDWALLELNETATEARWIKEDSFEDGR